MVFPPGDLVTHRTPSNGLASDEELARIAEETERARMLQDTDVAALLRQNRDLLREIRDNALHPQPQQHVMWPRDGGSGFLTAGENVFNFEDGLFTPADDNGDEQLSGRGVMHSVHLHPGSGGSFAVEVIGPTGKDAFSVNPFFMNWQHHIVHHLPISIMKIWVTLPIAMFVQGAERAETAPIEPIGDVGPNRWQASVTTTDSFASPTMRPTSFNPRTGTAAALSEARATNDNDGILTLSAQVVNTLFLREVTWVIRNTGEAAADIQLQGSQRGTGIFFVDDPETNLRALHGYDPTVDDFLVLPRGDDLVLRPQTEYLFQRMRSRSHGAGSPTTLTVDVNGLVGV